MASFIQNMIWNSVSGYVEAGKRTVGGYAGDALIKAGDMVEGGGRAVGTGIENKATGLGSSISGQTYKPSAKPLPSTARRPAAHRSNSLPANTKPASGTPLGAKKYPGAGAGAAKKQIGNGVTGARSAVGGVTKTAGGAVGGAKKTLGGVTGGLQKTAGSINKPAGGVVGGVVGGAKSSSNNLSKPLNSTVGGAGKAFGGLSNTAGKTLNGVNNTANSSAKRTLPKPYPQSGPNLPKPYSSSNAFPSTEKKTPVRPGQSKPFTPPKEPEEKKPYPGTNTLPGQGNKTPVKKYKPMQRYEPPAKKGEAKHLAI